MGSFKQWIQSLFGLSPSSSPPPHSVGRKSNSKPAAKKAAVSKSPPGVLVGKVTHYFPKVRAAAVQLQKGTLSLNDFILFEGKSNFKQRVNSLQIDRSPIPSARAGAEVGIEVNEEVFEGDRVYRLKD